MHRGRWLTLAGIAAVGLISLSWGDKGSPIFANPMLNLVIVIGLAAVGCFAVYKSGEQ